jgi:hypothetical protein
MVGGAVVAVDAAVAVVVDDRGVVVVVVVVEADGAEVGAGSDVDVVVVVDSPPSEPITSSSSGASVVVLRRSPVPIPPAVLGRSQKLVATKADAAITASSRDRRLDTGITPRSGAVGESLGAVVEVVGGDAQNCGKLGELGAPLGVSRRRGCCDGSGGVDIAVERAHVEPVGISKSSWRICGGDLIADALERCHPTGGHRDEDVLRVPLIRHVGDTGLEADGDDLAAFLQERLDRLEEGGHGLRLVGG